MNLNIGILILWFIVFRAPTHAMKFPDFILRVSNNSLGYCDFSRYELYMEIQIEEHRLTETLFCHALTLFCHAAIELYS